MNMNQRVIWIILLQLLLFRIDKVKVQSNLLCTFISSTDFIQYSLGSGPTSTPPNRKAIMATDIPEVTFNVLFAII